MKYKIELNFEEDSFNMVQQMDLEEIFNEALNKIDDETSVHLKNAKLNDNLYWVK